MASRTRRGPTHYELLRQYVQQYRDSGRPWPATSREIAVWAIGSGLWKPSQSAIITICAEAFAAAMREEYFTDPQGRTVRAKHAAKVVRAGKQLTLWGDMRTENPKFMATAFQNRRSQIVSDCRQLKLDVDSYNENRKPPKPFQLILDFTDDVAEAEAVMGLAA
jgi:hypothetical protein